jgi:hypothetical protein
MFELDFYRMLDALEIIRSKEVKGVFSWEKTARSKGVVKKYQSYAPTTRNNFLL